MLKPANPMRRLVSIPVRSRIDVVIVKDPFDAVVIDQAIIYGDRPILGRRNRKV